MTTQQNTNKATHRGHCQACGRFQLLPKDVLAKHGYKITHGYFSGICQGSGHKPFEQSYDMLPGFIQSATVALEGVERQQADLRTLPTEPKCYVHNYEAKTAVAYARGEHGNTYRWRKVTLITREVVVREGQPNESRYMETGYLAPSTAKSAWDSTFIADAFHKVEYYAARTSLIEIAHEMNVKLSNWMESEARSLREYIKWQQGRIDTWQKRPLSPVNAKDDKQGFKVIEPAYAGEVVRD